MRADDTFSASCGIKLPGVAKGLSIVTIDASHNMLHPVHTKSLPLDVEHSNLKVVFFI
jgi:hypothetical protein